MAEFLEALLSIFFIETVINGILLGGVLALLSLGLNLIFGVVDVVWICYAEIIMLGMYTIYFLVKAGVPLPLAILGGIAVTSILGYLTHKIVISRILDAAPINQLLATGGLLFFFQGVAMVAFGIEFRNLGVSLGSFEEIEELLADQVVEGLLGGELALDFFCRLPQVAGSHSVQRRRKQGLVGVLACWRHGDDEVAICWARIE